MLSTPSPETPPDDSAPDPEEEYRLLRHFVTSRRGFHLGLAVTDDDRVRDRLAVRLVEDAAASGVDVLSLDARNLSEEDILLKALIDLLAAHPPTDGRRRAVSVIGLERHLDYAHGGSRPAPTDLLATANFQRDAFPDRCPVPVVLWASVLAQPAIAQLAPDLWHWRAGSFDLCERKDATWAEQLEMAVPRPAEYWIRQPKEDLERRRVLLEELLAEDAAQPVNDNPDAWRRRQSLLLELSDVLFFGGDTFGALAKAREALTLAERLGDDWERAMSWDRIATVLALTGDLDEALRIRRDEQLPVFERMGDVRSKAVTQGKIADILQARGRLDEALRIRQDEQLPIFEQLGDVREKAVTQGQIADILQARGRLDEALHNIQNEVLPAFERLGDVRSKAVAQNRIANILQALGQLKEALRILQRDVLPVYEQLGDARSKAVTHGQIADILQARGQLDEALRIRQEEELPVYERLGNVREKAITQSQIAVLLMQRNPKSNRGVAHQLFRSALADLERMGIPEAKSTRQVMKHFGFSEATPPSPPPRSAKRKKGAGRGKRKR